MMKLTPPNTDSARAVNRQKTLRRIARALGGTRILLTPDYDPVEEITLYDGGSLDDCVELLGSVGVRGRHRGRSRRTAYLQIAAHLHMGAVDCAAQCLRER